MKNINNLKVKYTYNFNKNIHMHSFEQFNNNILNLYKTNNTKAYGIFYKIDNQNDIYNEPILYNKYELVNLNFDDNIIKILQSGIYLLHITGNIDSYDNFKLYINNEITDNNIISNNNIINMHQLFTLSTGDNIYIKNHLDNILIPKSNTYNIHFFISWIADIN